MSGEVGFERRCWRTYLCCLLMDREALCLELVSPNKRGIFVVIREKNK